MARYEKKRAPPAKKVVRLNDEAPTANYGFGPSVTPTTYPVKEDLVSELPEESPSKMLSCEQSEIHLVNREFETKAKYNEYKSKKRPAND